MVKNYWHCERQDLLTLGILQNNSEKWKPFAWANHHEAQVGNIVSELKVEIQEGPNEPPVAVIRYDIVRIQKVEVLVEVPERNIILLAVNWITKYKSNSSDKIYKE